MYVVFGANGNTGKVVASTLLDRGVKVRVVARDPGKVEALRARGAEVVTADVLDVASVAAALEGATGPTSSRRPTPERPTWSAAASESSTRSWRPSPEARSPTRSCSRRSQRNTPRGRAPSSSLTTPR